MTSSHGREDEIQRKQFQMQPDHMVGHESTNVLSSSLSTSRVQSVSELPTTESLSGVFGYFEDSDSNTIALIRKLSIHENDGQEARFGTSRANRVTLPHDTITEVQSTLERIPDRPIVDFLVQYYVTQVHWMDQLVYPPWFLRKYDAWWALGPLYSLDDVEFAILLLRICSYSSQFLPSPSHTIDRIRGMFLADIRTDCDNIAESLDTICTRIDLDCIPFLPVDGLGVDNMPRMHLGADSNPDDPEGPDPFTERILQARLARYWRHSSTRQGGAYQATEAENRYERFCSEYLATLPPTFALQPDIASDERFPNLALQRQVLHINIFDSLCWNFRPLLLLEKSHVQSLPQYKQVLLSGQRKALAVAALRVLQGVSVLHRMMGGSHTRFAGIIFPTFEAAVTLAYLCIGTGPELLMTGVHNGTNLTKTDPLGSGMAEVTRDRCIQAVYDALSRLETLTEVSSMAEIGAKTLARIINTISPGSPTKDAYDDTCKPSTGEIVSLSGSFNSAAASWSAVEDEHLSSGHVDLEGACADWEALVNFQAVSNMSLVGSEDNTWVS